jgi:hypothetical protein
MATTPTAAETHDQNVTDLRTALGKAVQWLYFSAGREAATDPAYSDRLIAEADAMTELLARTAPTGA